MSKIQQYFCQILVFRKPPMVFVANKVVFWANKVVMGAKAVIFWTHSGYLEKFSGIWWQIQQYLVKHSGIYGNSVVFKANTVLREAYTAFPGGRKANLKRFCRSFPEKVGIKTIPVN